MTLINATCDATASGAESAQVEFRLPSSKTVALCQHHTTELGSALFDQGAVVVDDWIVSLLSSAAKQQPVTEPVPAQGGYSAEDPYGDGGLTF